MCLAVAAVLDVVGSMWCCKFWSIRCASSQRHWVTQHSSLKPHQAAMTKMRRGERCLGGDRGAPNDKHENVCILRDCLLRSLSVSARNFLPVRLPICLSTVCWVTVCLRPSVSRPVCPSVSSPQSNVTLNVISFLTTLSLVSLRFQQSINNHIVKSKQNIITAVTCWASKRGNILII